MSDELILIFKNALNAMIEDPPGRELPDSVAITSVATHRKCIIRLSKNQEFQYVALVFNKDEFPVVEGFLDIDNKLSIAPMLMLLKEESRLVQNNYMIIYRVPNKDAILYLNKLSEFEEIPISKIHFANK